jgi:hypothetical protein
MHARAVRLGRRCVVLVARWWLVLVVVLMVVRWWCPLVVWVVLVRMLLPLLVLVLVLRRLSLLSSPHVHIPTAAATATAIWHTVGRMMGRGHVDEGGRR